MKGRQVDPKITRVEDTVAEATQIIAHKKFCQSFHVDTITIEFYEIDDFVFYYTQFAFNFDPVKLFKVLEVSLGERRVVVPLEPLSQVQHSSGNVVHFH